MYYVMAKLNAHGFCKLDFAVNFGIPIDVKSRYCELVNSQKVSRANCYQFFSELDDMVLLKLHKYLFWADKKLHHVFFIENKDQISEDLLDDFKDDGQRFKKSEQLGKKKNARPQTAAPQKKIIENVSQQINTDELMFGLHAKKKQVNIKDDEDFPDLDDDNQGG